MKKVQKNKPHSITDARAREVETLEHQGIKNVKSTKKRVRSKKSAKKKEIKEQPILQSLATKDLMNDRKASFMLTFKYELYFRPCTRFFSKFDYDFASDAPRVKDVWFCKRQFKLYDGYQKKALSPLTVNQLDSYFNGKLSYSLFTHLPVEYKERTLKKMARDQKA